MPRLFPFKAKPGCFRTGCLLLLLLPLILLFFLLLLQRSADRLPDRFVLALELGGALEERSPASSGLPFFGGDEPLSFQELLFLFERAADDKRVAGVLLDIDGLEAPPARIAELRRSISRLRSPERTVVAFLRSPEDSEYLLASACDSIVVERGGHLLLDGLRAETLYFGRTLEKAGISFQATRFKEYKSGVEPFVGSAPSRAHLEQVGALLDDVWADYIGSVAESRAIRPDTLASWIDAIALFDAERALRYGLIDGIDSPWRFRRSLERSITGAEPDPEGGLFVSGEAYRDHLERWPANHDTRERIALVTLSGPIVRAASGGMSEAEADVEGLRRSIDEALADDDVRSIVLRIDSPGGDALAAAEMLELLDSAAVRKPLVVSMSGVAASGGYMAALAGSTIFAEPLSITGSIGVYALKPEASGLVEKLELGRGVVTRGRYADAMSIFKPLDREAFAKFEEASGRVYDDFIEKVARSRKMTPADVEGVARGRVWTGRRALEAGLVDREGGVFEALREAQRLGGIDSAATPGILFWPRSRNWLELLLEGGLPAVESRIEGALARRLIERALSVEALRPGPVEAYRERQLRSGRPALQAIMPADISIR